MVYHNSASPPEKDWVQVHTACSSSLPWKSCFLSSAIQNPFFPVFNICLLWFVVLILLSSCIELSGEKFSKLKKSQHTIFQWTLPDLLLAGQSLAWVPWWVMLDYHLVGILLARAGLGKKFERKKVQIAEKIELFSSKTFFLQNLFGSYWSRGATTILKLVPNDEEWNDEISWLIST